MRDLELPGRSTVHGVEGAAATSQPLATLTAIETLKKGGNAVDAAVAAVAVLSMVEPMSTGLGGDCFALIAPGDGGPVIGYNGSGRAPRRLDAETLIAQGLREIGPESPHAVTVPGAVEAWARLVGDHGRLGLAEVLAPAIRVADEGFAVAPRCARDWANDGERVAGQPNFARHFLPNGRAPHVGERMRFPALAETLRAIAARGPDAFYTGDVAADLAAAVAEAGGLLDVEDIAGHRGEYVTPISTQYRGREVLQIPPNGHGIITLLILNILSHVEPRNLQAFGPERLHLLGEATRLAWVARDALVADPAHHPVPVAELLDPAYAAKLAGLIDPDRALDLPNPPVLPGSNTVYLTVVDRDRNVVSLINSIYFHFGTGITGRRSGVLLQNRGSGFVVEPGHPNCVAGGKRPLHTIIPGMVRENGRATLGYGVMGGCFQPVGHALFLTNHWDFGLDLQQALDAPRAFHQAGAYHLEKGIPEASARALAELGHKVRPTDEPLGGGQAIAVDWHRGTLVAASDPRKDGLALAY
jgi:gamma-glutamyltranspeptidase/glutathione hydrolase